MPPISFAATESPLIGLVNHWPLWLPLVVGALAIYWLLPRPRAYPAFWGMAAGVLALLLAGVWLIQTGAVWQETVLFYAFSAIAITAGGLLVTQSNPARAALSFTLVVLSTCGLFLLLAAPFLMAATIVVYAGAIVVTFLFVLMLAHQDGPSDADTRSREPLLATLTGFVLLGALLYVIRTSSDPARVAALDETLGDVRLELAGQPNDRPLTRGKALLRRLGVSFDASGDEIQQKEAIREALSKARDARVKGGSATELQQLERALESMESPFVVARSLVDGIGSELTARVERLSGFEMEEKKRPDALRGLEAVLLEARERLTLTQPERGAPLSDLSGPSAATPREDIRRDAKTGVPALPSENAAYLGRSLFTDYLLPVELGGFLLLVATVGAVAIGQRKPKAEPDDRRIA